MKKINNNIPAQTTLTNTLAQDITHTSNLNTPFVSPNKNELIIEISLSQLSVHPENPFIVEPETNPSMKELVESIKANGVQVPLIVRPLENGYQIVSGHRRYRACTYAGKTTAPCIIREMDDNTTKIIMCDANQQRAVTPMEKAKAMRMKIEALTALGREDRIRFAEAVLNNEIDPDGSKMKKIRKKADSHEIAAATARTSRANVFRQDRLNELTPELQEKVQDGVISVAAGVELSYLSYEEQDIVASNLDDFDKISTKQAQELRRLSDDHRLDSGSAITTLMKSKEEFMEQEKYKPYSDKGLFFTMSEVEPLFMAKGDYTPKEMWEKMLEILEEWARLTAESTYTFNSAEIHEVDFTGCETHNEERRAILEKINS